MTQLTFDGTHAVMRKISINVLGKGADHTLFTLALEGIELSREQLNEILGDRTFEAWYQQKPDGAWHPMEYWRLRKNGDYEVDDIFICEEACIEVSGGKEIAFETEEAEQEGEDDQPAAKVHSLVFRPTPGGVTLLSLHMQVRPGMDKDNLLLQKHQFRPIKLTLSGERKAKRNGAQQDLALSNGNGAQGEEGQLPVSGGFVQTRSAAEIDAEMRRRHPDGPVMGDEETARTQAAAATAKPGEVIDGTTPQSRAASRASGRTRHR